MSKSHLKFHYYTRKSDPPSTISLVDSVSYLRINALRFTLPVFLLFSPLAVTAAEGIHSANTGSAAANPPNAAGPASVLDSKKTTDIESASVPGKSPDSTNSPAPKEAPAAQPRPPGDAVAATVDNQPKLEQFLGEMKAIFEKPSKVEGYLVGSEPAAPQVPEESKIGGYPVRKGPVNLTPEQAQAIQAFVLDANSYFWGPPTKKCVLAPQVALRFIKGTQEVSILFSDYCGLWSFVNQNKLLATKDYAPKVAEINGFLKTLSFP